MSKSKEFYCPLDDDAAKQLELIVIETPECDISINVFDITSIDTSLPKKKQKNYLN